MMDTSLLETPLPSFGPAMRFVLAVATLRAREGERRTSPATLLWDLAERYHPEETWLAESYLRGERSLDELARHAPREGLAPSLQAAAQPLITERYESIFSNHGNATGSA
jgi:hypothetical protein